MFESIYKAKEIKGSSSEKFSTLLTLLRLKVKRKLFNNKELVNESFFNFKFLSYNYSTLYYLFDEVFVSGEYYFESLTKEPLIIDCGANIGMSVLYFKKLYPNSKIIAFEANPNVFKLLEKNISTNNIKNVELHNIALYNEETEISFFIGGNPGTLVGSINKERGGTTELKVKTQKLSFFLNKFESIDLIKMDVEGAELNIIAELFESSTIGRAKEYIIEYHHNMNQDKSNLSAFLEKFEANGFNYNIKSSFSSINTFQDILIHFYKIQK